MLSKHVLVGSRAGTDVCVLDMDAPTVAYTNTGSTGASVPTGVQARAAADAEQGVLQCVCSHFLGFLGQQVCAPHVPAQTCVRTSACQRVQPCKGPRQALLRISRWTEPALCVTPVLSPQEHQVQSSSVPRDGCLRAAHSSSSPWRAAVPHLGVPGAAHSHPGARGTTDLCLPPPRSRSLALAKGMTQPRTKPHASHPGFSQPFTDIGN